MLRGVVSKFGGMMKIFKDAEEHCLDAVAEAEARDQPLAVERLHRAASKAAGEAAAL